jgi:hypothetical protein
MLIDLVVLDTDQVDMDNIMLMMNLLCYQMYQLYIMNMMIDQMMDLLFLIHMHCIHLDLLLM